MSVATSMQYSTTEQTSCSTRRSSSTDISEEYVTVTIFILAIFLNFPPLDETVADLVLASVVKRQACARGQKQAEKGEIDSVGSAVIRGFGGPEKPGREDPAAIGKDENRSDSCRAAVMAGKIVGSPREVRGDRTIDSGDSQVDAEISDPFTFGGIDDGDAHDRDKCGNGQRGIAEVILV